MTTRLESGGIFNGECYSSLATERIVKIGYCDELMNL